MPPLRAAELVDAARAAPLSDPEVAYPKWYLHRWHCLPEGYLSRRSAAGYDRVVRNVYNAFSESEIASDLVRRIRAAKPASVLEVGAGPGRLLARITRGGFAGRLAGVELSPYLLERARDRLMGKDVQLIHGDGLNLPRTLEQFDTAVACHYVGHLPLSLRMIAATRLAQTVRLGGSVFIVDHRWHHWPNTPLLSLRNEAFHALGTVRLSMFERVEPSIAVVPS